MSSSPVVLNKFEGPDYTVVLQHVFRQECCIDYLEGARTIKFFCDRAFGDRQVDVRVTAELFSEDTPRVLQNIAVALSKMRLEYVIYRTHVDPVPEEDRQAAIAALRAVGFQAELRKDGSVKLSKIPGSFPGTGDVSALADEVAGRRTHREVLARSAHAEGKQK